MLLRHDYCTSIFVITTFFLASVANAVEPGFRIIDEFENKFSLDWSPVRHDPDLVSLGTHPGKLTIQTQPGSLGYDETRPGRIATRNLHFIANPVEDEEDFVITTCIESFHPTMRWQQAGLMIYDDDDNYLKYDIEWGGSNVCFKHMRETDQLRLVDTDSEVPNAERHWLRLIKRGNVYERSFSTDGENFTSAGEKSWGDANPKWIGLVATNGSGNAPGIDVVFDFFEVRDLTKAERNDPRYLARQKLKGKWDVTNCEFKGESLEQNAFEGFEFDGGYVSFAEVSEVKSTEYRLEYSVDPTTSPKGFVMSAFLANAKTPLNGNYSIDGDELRIILAFTPGAKVPNEFKTNEDDSRMVIQLTRKGADVIDGDKN